jgi:hypothetical protein
MIMKSETWDVLGSWMSEGLEELVQAPLLQSLYIILVECATAAACSCMSIGQLILIE